MIIIEGSVHHKAVFILMYLIFYLDWKKSTGEISGNQFNIYPKESQKTGQQ